MLVQELLAIYTYAHRIIILTIYSRVRWRQVDSLRQKIGTIRDVALVYSLLWGMGLSECLWMNDVWMYLMYKDK
jgi:hypothetical protein